MRSKFILIILLMGSIIYLTLSYDKRKTNVTIVKSRIEQHIASMPSVKDQKSNALQQKNEDKPAIPLINKVSEGNQAEYRKYINSLVFQIPSKREFDYSEKSKEIFRIILQDKVVTRLLFRTFSNQRELEILFGKSHAEARVKLIEFFSVAGSEYRDEILETILAIQRDPAFLKNQKGRELDYRDIVSIHLKNIANDDFKKSIANELKRINYSPKNRKIVALAIFQAYPNLINDKEFVADIIPYLKGEKI